MVVYKCSVRKQVLGRAVEETLGHPASTWPPVREPTARASCQSMIPVPFKFIRPENVHKRRENRPFDRLLFMADNR